MTRHLGRRSELLIMALLVTAAAGGCGGLSGKPAGVAPPKEEQREITPTSLDDKIKTEVSLLSNDTKWKTLRAAQHLGDVYKADAAAAIPELRKLSTMPPGDDGFPDDEQKAAFKDALDKIIADMNAKNIPVPPEGAAAAPADATPK